jgi:hypothetical protein
MQLRPRAPQSVLNHRCTFFLFKKINDFVNHFESPYYELSALLALLKEVPIPFFRAVTVPINATAIKATIRAYSTMVAPSSSLQKLISFLIIFHSPFMLVCGCLCFVFGVYCLVVRKNCIPRFNSHFCSFGSTTSFPLTLFQKTPLR